MFSPAILKVVVLMSLPMRKVPCRSKPPRVTHILGDRNTTNILSLTSLVNPCAKPERSLLKHLSSLLSPHSCKRGKRTCPLPPKAPLRLKFIY
ncbi:hypothetical protein PSTT_11766, partial [Puccinia striiformis]